MACVKENNNDVLIVSFGSMARPVANRLVSTRKNRPVATRENNSTTIHETQQHTNTSMYDAYFDFYNFLPDTFKNVDLHFYGDLDQYCYHKGIRGISNDIESTVKYLREKICNRYKKVIFIGLSGGGYAAILFGSLLNIDHVVAFYPLTLLIEKRLAYNSKYKDVLPYINKTTQYHLFAVDDPINKCHNPQQCQRICVSENVILKTYNIKDDIKILMKTCDICDVLNKIINE